MQPLDKKLVDEARMELASMREGPWHEPGKWSVSPYNFLDSIKERQTAVPPKITISELTPRLLEQMPGVFLSSADRMLLLEQMAEMNIPEVHVGILPYKSPLLEEVRLIAKRGFPFNLVAVIHNPEQAAILADAGVDTMEVVTFPRPILQAAVMGRKPVSTEVHLSQAAATLEAIKKLGVKVRADVTDVGIADLAYIEAFSRNAHSLKVDSIHIADSSSTMGHHATAEIVRLVKSVAPGMPVGLHPHNDFGLAMATAVAGLEAGVEIFDTSVDGIGEKAGQLNLGTFVLVCEAFYRIKTGINLEGLQKLSILSAKLSGMPIPCYTPLTGEDAFSATLEHHRRLQDEVDPMILASISPAVVGNRKHNSLGLHSGKYGLWCEAKAMDIELTEEQLDVAHKQLLGLLKEHRRRITRAEIEKVLHSVSSV